MILALCVALTTTLFFAVISRAAPGVQQTIGFQGRLLDAEGDIVPDGYYNIEFKIYEGGTGTAAGNPGGTLQWSEAYINNGSTTGAVEVKNGYLSLNLGSVTPFEDSVDWSSDALWLSMNIAGSAVNCTEFGTAPCADDGEMLPMKRLTASPYAMSAGSLNGKTADNFVQLAGGVQTDASTNTSSIFINKTGSGNLVQLQSASTDIFTVSNEGDLTLGSNADKTISIATANTNEDGRQLSVTAGAGGTGDGSAGGDLMLQGGAAGGTNGNGGNVIIDAGSKTGSGANGTISIGTNGASSVTVGSGASATNGTTTIQAKNAVSIATNGTTRATFSDTTNTVYFGNGVSSATPNDYILQGTNSTSAATGGSLSIQGGNATTGDANGGNVTLAGGAGNGNGANGLVVLTTPTFSTVTNDAQCYTGGATVADDCTVTASSVNNSSAVLVGFSAAGHTATLPDPSITTAGRILYIMASGDSESFTLVINGGGNGNEITMRKNTTATLLWNGSDWTLSGTSNSATLQDTYNVGETAGNVQIGDGEDNAQLTLLTVDKSAAAPLITDDALLGSMYYDTTLGKVQCYEAEGWGDCGSKPDTFITLSPTYSNAVINGSGIGTMDTDLCSDALDINDGSSSQPTVCGTNETFNFYNWTSPELTDQTRSIYVTYQLPSTFKEFVAGSTSLMGRTDSNDASVSYQVYRNNSTSGLTACGSVVDVSTGSQTTWQKEVATNTSDPSTCGFEAGDSIVFKITLTASNDAHAYVSNLGFTFSNQ